MTKKTHDRGKQSGERRLGTRADGGTSRVAAVAVVAPAAAAAAQRAPGEPAADEAAEAERRPGLDELRVGDPHSLAALLKVRLEEGPVRRDDCE
jgi:hypothetical protein